MLSDITYFFYQQCHTEEQCKQEEEAICDIIRKGTGGWQLTSAFDDQQWYFYLGLASALMALAIAAIIWDTKELQAHPMRLFMYITVAEAMLGLVDDTSHLICDLHLHDLFSYTVYFSNSI